MEQKGIKSADNIINDHLKNSDLSDASGDLQGNLIAKPNGGYWNHAQEFKLNGRYEKNKRYI